MAKRMVLVAFVLAFSLLLGFGGLAFAETEVVSDERFEKLAKELYPKALKEGEVILYSGWDTQDVIAIFKGFSKQFPGIKTNYWQATNAAIASRLTAEFRAGQGSVDVVLASSAIPPLQSLGAFMPYETVQKDALILQDPPNIIIVGVQVNTLAYNTKKIKIEDLPKSWEDIVNPKYKGIVALDDPMRGGPMSEQLATFKQLWKDDVRWTNFVKGLKSLNVPGHRSTGAMFRLLVSGEYSLAEPAFLSDIIVDKAKESPVDFVKSVPPILNPRYAGIYVKSPHPNAAKLLAEWFVSPAGQAVVCSTGKEVNRKGIRCETSLEANWPSGTKPIGGYNQEYNNDPRKWLETNVKPIWEAK